MAFAMSIEKNISKNDWIEIATFYSTSWNVSSFSISFGAEIYTIGFGSTPTGYIERCNAYLVTSNKANSHIGFKVIDNVLHIYAKPTQNAKILQANILCYQTEGEKCNFSLSSTNMQDSDMDLIK